MAPASARGDPPRRQSQQLALSLPPGRLDVDIVRSPDDGSCVVASVGTTGDPSSRSCPLRAGDAIESLNGTVLADVRGGVATWTSLLDVASGGTRTVIVRRPFGPPCAENRYDGASAPPAPEGGWSPRKNVEFVDVKDSGGGTGADDVSEMSDGRQTVVQRIRSQPRWLIALEVLASVATIVALPVAIFEAFKDDDRGAVAVVDSNGSGGKSGGNNGRGNSGENSSGGNGGNGNNNSGNNSNGNNNGDGGGGAAPSQTTVLSMPSSNEATQTAAPPVPSGDDNSDDGRFAYVGRGNCQDGTGNYYDYAGYWGVPDAEACGATYCGQFRDDVLVGYFWSEPDDRACWCALDAGILAVGEEYADCDPGFVEAHTTTVPDLCVLSSSGTTGRGAVGGSLGDEAFQCYKNVNYSDSTREEGAAAAMLNPSFAYVGNGSCEDGAGKGYDYVVYYYAESAEACGASCGKFDDSVLIGFHWDADGTNSPNSCFCELKPGVVKEQSNPDYGYSECDSEFVEKFSPDYCNKVGGSSGAIEGVSDCEGCTFDPEDREHPCYKNVNYSP